MTTPLLFTPLTLRDMTLANRVQVAPMCQYSATDGVASDWHLQHYGAMSASGVGLITVEATGVVPEGRISDACLGLYDDATEAALTRLVKLLRAVGPSKLSIQLAHAGRKASSSRPWTGGGPLKDGAWPTVSASATAFDTGWPTARALSAEELTGVAESFADAARRALRAGFDTVEIHSAHGYLLHQFLSPLTNQRTDEYGGSLENRMRFPLMVVRAVRAVWPAEKPLGIRISATDWVEGGWDLDQAVEYAKAFKEEGVDFVCVSSGGLVPYAKIPVGPGYQVALAERIRRETGLVTRAVGLIADGLQAEEVLQAGQADLIALGRAIMDDPRWVWRAAVALGAEAPIPLQYRAAAPKAWPGHALAHPAQAAE